MTADAWVAKQVEISRRRENLTWSLARSTKNGDFVESETESLVESNSTIVIRLSALGWTQQEIGGVVGKAQNTISEIIEKFRTEQIDNFHSEGKSIEQIASALNREKSTISPYVSDILQQRMATVKSIVIRLSALGWTQKRIGEVVGMTHGRVAQIVNKFGPEQINNFYEDGKTPEQISEAMDVDIQTVWHYLLKS